MKERDVIRAFVAHLAANGYPGLTVDRWPEDENRTTPEIDAIAGSFTIEHTSTDTLPNQRRDSAWFTKVVGGFAAQLQFNPQFSLEITLEYDAICEGQDWPAIRLALRHWVENEAQHLVEGSSVVESPQGIPFRLHVEKSLDRPWGVFFARFQPDDDTLPARVKGTLDRKAAKLAQYQQSGDTTILLIESADKALMAEGKMIEAIRAGFPSGPPAGVDQVWFAHTRSLSTIKFRDITPDLWTSSV